ncbi:MAG: amylo-alpha-1,6-glucosidase, partial [Acidimicrobiales bacterium]
GAADRVGHIYRQSLIDLAALRFRPNDDIEWSIPAAGLPWFMTLFGRDSLLTSYMALPFQPHLAAATLETLAALQATKDDPFRDAEPGKILHELRRGKLTALGRRPHSPYFGTHDATPLFLILLDEYERWTADVALVSRLEPAARAAMAWIEGPADLDDDGYLEYRSRSAQGLANQCWKDSWNSILFADGRLAAVPIATCEIQGYAYDARRRTARLAREVWGDPGWADRLDAAADALGERFNRDFWDPLRGSYVLALDAGKQPVDSLTSNVGHLLWSGIVPDDRAQALAELLTGPVMNSGWGVRTMSPLDAGYNPIEYHNGTVWPHDTAIVAEGLRRYGYRSEAAVLAGQLFEAAEAFDYRLPEVFAGFDRTETLLPIEYPTASRPQAWSSAAPLLGLRTILDLDIVDGHLTANGPAAGFEGLRLTNVAVRGGWEDTR